jgi:thioredoxin-related protein
MRKIRSVLLSLLLLAGCASRADTPNTITLEATEKDVSPIALQADRSLQKGIEWWDMSARALMKASREGKLVMLYIGDDTCEPCVIMDRATLSDPEVIRVLNESAVSIMMSDEMRQKIETQVGGLILPTVMFLDSKGQHLVTFQGFVSPSQFKAALDVLVLHVSGMRI